MKKIHYLYFLALVVCFSACDSGENSPGYGPKSVMVDLQIVDKNNRNLLAGKLETKDYFVISSFELTGVCNGKTIKEERLLYFSDLSMLRLSSNLQDYKVDNNTRTGNLEFTLQLPTVFEDNRKTVINLKWKYHKDIKLDEYVEIQSVSINGIAMDTKMPIVWVVEDM